MEYLEGVKFVDGIRQQYKRLAALSGRTLEEIEQERKEQIQKGTFQFKSIEESKAEKAHIDRMLMINDITNPKNILKFFYNYSPLAWLYGAVQYEHSDRTVDLGSCVELLSRVHANQIFEHGE
jgi:ribosomal protein L30E